MTIPIFITNIYLVYEYNIYQYKNIAIFISQLSYNNSYFASLFS